MCSSLAALPCFYKNSSSSFSDFLLSTLPCTTRSVVVTARGGKHCVYSGHHAVSSISATFKDRDWRLELNNFKTLYVQERKCNCVAGLLNRGNRPWLWSLLPKWFRYFILRTAKSGTLQRHKNNKKKLFLEVYVICTMTIPFRRSFCTPVLSGENSFYLVAEERHQKIRCIKLFLLPFTAVLIAEPNGRLIPVNALMHFIITRMVKPS